MPLFFAFNRRNCPLFIKKTDTQEFEKGSFVVYETGQELCVFVLSFNFCFVYSAVLSLEILSKKGYILLYKLYF